MVFGFISAKNSYWDLARGSVTLKYLNQLLRPRETPMGNPSRSQARMKEKVERNYPTQ